MRILIVSDTHQSPHTLDQVVMDNPDIDMLIHLGDSEDAEDYIRSLVDCPVYILAGNCDGLTRLPRELDLDLCGYHAFLTHGHQYRVSQGEQALREEALRRGADIVMYGHTHIPVCHEEEGLLILNPGSVSYPRQEGKRGSYIVMEIDENGEIYCEIKYL